MLKLNENNQKYIEALKKGNKELINLIVDSYSALSNELDKANI